jgi:hypothetical protein
VYHTISAEAFRAARYGELWSLRSKSLVLLVCCKGEESATKPNEACTTLPTTMLDLFQNQYAIDYVGIGVFDSYGCRKDIFADLEQVL